MKTTLVFSVLLMIMFSSCRVEKRLYSSGYHVVWPSADKKIALKSSLQKNEKIELRKLKSRNKKPQITLPLEPVSENWLDKRVVANPIGCTKHSVLGIDTIQDTIQDTIRVSGEEALSSSVEISPNTEKDKKLEPLSVTAIILGVLALLFMGTQLLFFSLAAFSLSVVVFALSIASMERNQRHPDKYKDKNTAVIILILSLGLIVLAGFAVSNTLDQLFEGIL